MMNFQDKPSGQSSGGRALWLFLLALSMVADQPAIQPPLQQENSNQRTLPAITGVASYYADKYHGKLTANGEVFDMYAMTAAHPSYPFGTRLKVTHLETRRSVIVRINDRGPFVKGRVIDLSLAAAQELRMVTSGLAQVQLEILE